MFLAQQLLQRIGSRKPGKGSFIHKIFRSTPKSLRRSTHVVQCSGLGNEEQEVLDALSRIAIGEMIRKGVALCINDDDAFGVCC